MDYFTVRVDDDDCDIEAGCYLINQNFVFN